MNQAEIEETRRAQAEADRAANPPTCSCGWQAGAAEFMFEHLRRHRGDDEHGVVLRQPKLLA